MGLKENLRDLETLRAALGLKAGAAAFGAEIRAARTSRGMTLEAFAAVTGMAKSYLSQIETGSAPPPRDDKVRKIAQALGLDEETLVARAHLSQLPAGVKDRMDGLRQAFDSAEDVIRALLEAKRTSQAISPGPDRPAAATPGAPGAPAPGASADSQPQAGQGGAPSAGIDRDALDKTGLLYHLQRWSDERDDAVGRPAPRRIPIINKVAAGSPQEFTDLGYPVGIADDYVAAPPELSDPNAFGLRVSGDSMEPRYHEGDVVIFSPAAPVKSGDDCFVRFAMAGGLSDGEMTFKRVFFDAEDRIRLQPLNERRAPTMARPNEIAAIFRAVVRYEKL